MSVHPSVEEWIRFVGDESSARDRRRLESHLRECEACRGRESEVRQLLEAMTTDRLLEPPPAPLAAAYRAYRSGAPALPAWAAGMPERIGRLVFDTFAHPRESFAGARSSAVARRLRFEAGVLELDVLVEVQGDRRRLTAQVLSLGEQVHPRASALFLVTVGGSLEAEGETDEYGEFVREIAAPGEIEIRVAAGRRLAVFRIPERLAEEPSV